MNRAYEFYANFENHPLGNQEIYRLRYINYHRIGENFSQDNNNIGIVDWPLKPFYLPVGMGREEAFKVLSYLTDFIENTLNLEPCSSKSVIKLDKVLNLARLGFSKIDAVFPINSKEVIDLFTVTGRLLLFKRSAYYKRYFDWYTEGVTFDEVKEIYSRCGIEFYDLTFDKDPQKLIREKK